MRKSLRGEQNTEIVIHSTYRGDLLRLNGSCESAESQLAVVVRRRRHRLAGVQVHVAADVRQLKSVKVLFLVQLPKEQIAPGSAAGYADQSLIRQEPEPPDHAPGQAGRKSASQLFRARCPIERSRDGLMHGPERVRRFVKSAASDACLVGADR